MVSGIFAGDCYFFGLKVKSNDCQSCRSVAEARKTLRPSPEEFMKFLPWFLQDNAEMECAKG